MVLEVARVDRATNDVSSAAREKYLALVAEHLVAEKVAVYEPTMAVAEEYLQAACDAVAEDYGSVGGYLRDGLGLGEDVLDALRIRLVG